MNQIHNLTSAAIPAVMALQQAYSAVYPDASIIPGEVYLSPAFHFGEDVFLLFDGERPLGYSVIYAAGAPGRIPTLWAEVKTDPTLPAPTPVRDQLLARLIARAQTLAEGFPGVELTFQYYPTETTSIRYLLEKGATAHASIYTMKRDLALPIPTPEPPASITIKPWRVESEAEQRRYLDAYNEAFPESPMELVDWQYFMLSPQWAVGTLIAAFDGEVLAGSVTVYWEAAANEQRSRKIGATESVFVRDGWRGRGLATALLSASLLHLRAHGLDEATLEVKAENRAALSVYERLYYRVERESRLYTLPVS